MNSVGAAAVVLCSAIVPGALLAETTGIAGGSQPVPNLRPSRAITYGIRNEGLFPSGSSPVGTIGEISMFASSFVPDGYLPADGRALPISGNEILFAALGVTYGGDGVNTFALPDLRGRVAVGAGAGPGLIYRPQGQSYGRENVTLSAGNLALHSHLVPGGITPVSNPAGASGPYQTSQPSLAINYVMSTTGYYPGNGGSSATGVIGSDPMLGMIYQTAAQDFLLGSWTVAAGQSLPISSNLGLYTLLGTNYGGNGTSTFNLPDLRGRTPVGVGGAHPLAAMTGWDTATLSVSQLPAHGHLINSLGTDTSIVGGGLPIENQQPTLALHYIIATDGAYPTQTGFGGTTDGPLLGQISLFAGNFAPSGWAFCDGQLMSISSNPSLFSVLGINFGGNGMTTFALPNLDDTLALGTGQGPGLSSWSLNQYAGATSYTMTEAQMPAHTHDVEVPEPTGMAALLLGFAGISQRRRKREV